MEIKSIEDKLKERAYYTLKNKLDRVFQEINDLTYGYGCKSTLYFENNATKSFEQVSVGYALQTLQRNLQDGLLPHYVQIEIDNFINRVENLQDQLNELREEIQNDE